MLDFDLANFYGYTTKAFNQQVKRNEDRFDPDFRFQLTAGEASKLSKSQNVTSLQTKGIKSDRSIPIFTFTEQGIYMLMKVFKGELAVRQSKALIRVFKSMKDYIVENRVLIGPREILQLADETRQNTKDIAEIKATMATKKDLQNVIDNFTDYSFLKHFLILDGERVEIDKAYRRIYQSAKKSIIVIDPYFSLKTLYLFRAAKPKVDIVVISDNPRNRDMLTGRLLNDFRAEYPEIAASFKRLGGRSFRQDQAIRLLSYITL